LIAHPLPIDGVWKIQSDIFADTRGTFSEWFKHSSLSELTGRTFNPMQANISTSRSGVIRGIHYSLATGGQAKLVTVLSGSILDVAIDVRVGSPTFGKYVTVEMNAGDGNSVFLSHDMAHAFQALENNTVVSYLVSSEYSPHDEKEITPLCTDLNIVWSPELPRILSEKDLGAPGLKHQKKSGLLPIYKSDATEGT